MTLLANTLLYTSHVSLRLIDWQTHNEDVNVVNQPFFAADARYRWAGRV